MEIYNGNFVKNKKNATFVCSGSSHRKPRYDIGFALRPSPEAAEVAQSWHTEKSCKGSEGGVSEGLFS